MSGKLLWPPFLKNGAVVLAPFSDDYASCLLKLAKDERIWLYDIVDVSNPTLLYEHVIGKAKKQIESGLRYMFIIFNLGQPVGTTSYYHFDIDTMTMNIGYTWINPDYWGAGINAIAKQLLIDYAFNVLNLQQIRFSIDVNNLRSRKAIEKLGASYVKTIEHHFVRVDKSVRDSVIYAITKSAWQSTNDRGVYGTR